jgi:hypothetical protein
LTVFNSIKNVSFVAEIYSVLKKLYSFNQHSPKKIERVEKKITTILKNELLKFKYLHSVWWVANRVDALTALINKLSCSCPTFRINR